MASMTGRERVLCVLNGDVPDRVPYLENGIDIPFMYRLLQRELASDQFFEPGEHVTPPLDMQKDVNEILHRDNVKNDARPPIPAEMIEGKDQILFYHDGYVKTLSDLDRLQFEDQSTEKIRGPMREFVEQSGDYATVLSTRVGISATYLAMGMEHFYVSLKEDPKLVEEVFRRYVDWSVESVYAAAELGYDAVWTSDDIAGKTGALWSPQMFDEIFLPHVRRFAHAIQDAEIPWIFHSDGDMSATLGTLLDLGITALNPIEPACMDIKAVREEYPELVLVGNVDVDLLARASPEEVRATVRRLMRDVAPSGRYCAASGNSVATYCDVDNVIAMCDAIQEFGAYPIAV
jgi:hypothetical protein